MHVMQAHSLLPTQVMRAIETAMEKFPAAQLPMSTSAEQTIELRQLMRRGMSLVLESSDASALALMATFLEVSWNCT
jgi:hypothetical protein